MAVLGLLLLLLTGALTIAVLLRNTDPTTPHAFGQTVQNVSLGELFLAGAVTGLLFALGLYLLFRGLGRARRRKVERRRIMRETEQQQASLAAEKARLENELAQERSRRATSAPVTTERVVEREPVTYTTEAGAAEGRSDGGNDRPRLFRR